MKRTMLTLTALALAVTFGVATANAQANSDMRADIPFNFTVGNAAIPAGNCAVLLSSPVARIACANDQAGIVGLPASANATGPMKLVFHRYGDQYFLTEVWTHSRGLILAQSAAEKQMRAAPNTTAVLLQAIP